MNKYGYPGIIQIYELSDAIQLPKFDLIHRENNWKDSANKSLFILDIFINKYIIKKKLYHETLHEYDKQHVLSEITLQPS